MWAAQLHYGQVRDGEPTALPYVCHPLEVMGYLRHVGGICDEEMLCGAALHDSVEDCNVNFEDIEERFGPRVTFFVREMTRQEPEPHEIAGMTKGQVWELRSSMLLDEIRKMPPEVWPLKLADRLSNIREARYAKSGKKLQRYIGQTRTILEIIPERINPKLWSAVLAELPKFRPSKLK